MASFLGPILYGTYGSLVVIQQLLGYATLGIREGVLVELSQRPKDAAENIETYSSSLAFAGSVGIFLPIAVLLIDIVFQAASDLNHLLCALICAVSLVNDILLNLNRYEGNLSRVTFCETSYNAISLILILVLRNHLTIGLTQGAILVALVFSVSVYVLLLKRFSLQAVSFGVIKRLVSIGFFSAILSAVLLFSNSMFILLAKRHLSNFDAGQYVFANNLASFLMVSVNAFSWAMTSKAMGAIASPRNDHTSWQRVLRIDAFHRVGVALVGFAAICVSIVFPFISERYIESSRYVLLFVSIQSLPLIVSTELSFILIKRKAGVAAAIFCLVVLINIAIVELLINLLTFQQIIIITLFVTSLAMFTIIAYAVSLGLKGDLVLPKLVSTSGVFMTMLIYSTLGANFALAFAMLVVVNVVWRNWCVVRYRQTMI